MKESLGGKSPPRRVPPGQSLGFDRRSHHHVHLPVTPFVLGVVSAVTERLAVRIVERPVMSACSFPVCRPQAERRCRLRRRRVLSSPCSQPGACIRQPPVWRGRAIGARLRVFQVRDAGHGGSWRHRALGSGGGNAVPYRGDRRSDVRGDTGGPTRRYAIRSIRGSGAI